MRQFYLIAVILLIGFCGSAQPILSESNFNNDLSANVYTAGFLGFTAGPGGENQTWDFSALALTPAGVRTVRPASEGPLANYFSDATMWINDAGTYYYYSVSADAYELLGITSDSNTLYDFNANRPTILTLPYTYGTVFTDTYEASEVPSATTAIRTYDGYGTLILPFGTFTNVIRQRTDVNNTTIYTWYNTDPFYSLLETDSGELRFYENTVLGTNKVSAAIAPAVFPNPNDGTFHISKGNQLGNTISLDLYDLQGKLLRHDESLGFDTAGTVGVDMPQSRSGIYMLKITDTESGMCFWEKVSRR